ncbi:RIC1 [Acanthosepion pharaonis]|uniref:RIC1 n=1 Tax=Acanthosepion pharaonis TaxID=158019 RepID=A0A812D9Y5_ACAPH|nr:RIC1 [Sepia pharaonis]
MLFDFLSYQHLSSQPPTLLNISSPSNTCIVLNLHHYLIYIVPTLYHHYIYLSCFLFSYNLYCHLPSFCSFPFCLLLFNVHATQLLDAALDRSQWNVARDLIRFLRAIDPTEADSNPPCSVLTRMSSNSMYNPPYPNPPITPTEKAPFGITDVQRTSSFSGSEPQVKDSSRVSESTKVPCVQDTTSSSSTKRRNSRAKEESSPDQFYIDQILNRHARKLLSSHRLRDLGMFSANMQDFQLVGWLRKER